MPLSGLLERRPAAYSVPDDTVVYAVGDIHGCANLLDVMHGMILQDSQIPEFARKVLIYLGDYVDRGANSKGVVDRILEKPLEGFENLLPDRQPRRSSGRLPDRLRNRAPLAFQWWSCHAAVLWGGFSA
ncbi:MAG: metallophosphoesterase [Rhodospirillaceae bacterium]|nr:metallophosphoesterase [Rhodospirillaceae bacterium]